MKYIDDFRDGTLAQSLARQLVAEARPDRQYRLMEFCGGHTHTIFRYGIPDLLPTTIRMVHGPGCPVCVLPIGRLDMAIDLSRDHAVTLCTYGDMMRVPGSRRRSLLKAKAEGADIRLVYSARDSLALAEAHPDRQVVFFAIGFETTTPPTAAVLRAAKSRGVRNFSVFCNHVLTPAAMDAILDVQADDPAQAVQIDGFLGPAHVSIVIGSQAYERFAGPLGKPVVISGFEPLDVMHSILMLVRQLNEGRADVENQYTRAVDRWGNRTAQALMEEVFVLRPAFEWRGLGTIPTSALALSEPYSDFDAERRFTMTYRMAPENKACACPSILRGLARPTDCRLFGRQCTPQTPLGSCMVSDEGACAAYYKYGRTRQPAAAAA